MMKITKEDLRRFTNLLSIFDFITECDGRLITKEDLRRFTNLLSIFDFITECDGRLVGNIIHEFPMFGRLHIAFDQGGYVVQFEGRAQDTPICVGTYSTLNIDRERLLFDVAWDIKKEFNRHIENMLSV